MLWLSTSSIVLFCNYFARGANRRLIIVIVNASFKHDCTWKKRALGTFTLSKGCFGQKKKEKKEKKEKSLSVGETDLEVTDRHDGCELMPNAFTTFACSVCRLILECCHCPSSLGSTATLTCHALSLLCENRQTHISRLLLLLLLLLVVVPCLTSFSPHCYKNAFLQHTSFPFPLHLPPSPSSIRSCDKVSPPRPVSTVWATTVTNPTRETTLRALFRFTKSK